MNQNGVFYKTPSSHFYLIETFSSPNPFSSTLLITCLMTCDRFNWRERLKSKLGNSFLRYQASTPPFYFLLFLSVLILFLCLVYVFICLYLVLCLFDVYKHARLLELGFSFMLCFSILCFWVKVLNKSHTRMS